MSNKLGAGEQFPSINLNVGSDQSISVPEDLETEYTMLLIYRGHWCPLCMRNLAKYKEHLAELEAMNCGVIAGSVDDLDKATEVGADLGFPVAHGLTRNRRTHRRLVGRKASNHTTLRIFAGPPRHRYLLYL